MHAGKHVTEQSSGEELNAHDDEQHGDDEVRCAEAAEHAGHRGVATLIRFMFRHRNLNFISCDEYKLPPPLLPPLMLGGGHG